MRRSLTPVYGWLLVLPATILLITFTHFPAIATFWHSLFSTQKARRPAQFIGLENYSTMLDDTVFWKSLWNNLWYAIGTVPISIALALAMALWINQKIVGRSFLRMAYFTPTVLPMVAVANIWLFFYTPQYGLLNQLGQIFGFPDINWLGSSNTALGAIITVAI